MKTGCRVKRGKSEPRVKLIVTHSKCRGGYCKEGDTYIVEDICPSLCQKLWNQIHPCVFVLRNGALLDQGRKSHTGF